MVFESIKFLESLQHLVTVNFINVNCVKRFFSFVCSVVCDMDDLGMFVTYCNFSCPFLLYRHKASYNFVLGHLSFFNSMLVSFGPFLQFTKITFSLVLSFQAPSTSTSLVSQIFTCCAVTHTTDASSDLIWVCARPPGLPFDSCCLRGELLRFEVGLFPVKG